MNKLKRVYSDIKSVKIQGATNIALTAVKTYLANHNLKTKKKLLSLRKTEPMMRNALVLVDEIGPEKVLEHFAKSQELINKNVFNLIRKKSKIMTHCHSNTIVQALVYAKKKGKRFEVFNTETRPLYQGRLTARQLARAKIKVTTTADSAFHDSIEEADIVLIGADAILESGVINKIGSRIIAEMASFHKKPMYIVSDSWKFSSRKVGIEERDFHEVWKSAPKNVIVKNPAFEKVPFKFIKGIVSEYGTLSYKNFIKKARSKSLA